MRARRCFVWRAPVTATAGHLTSRARRLFAKGNSAVLIGAATVVCSSPAAAQTSAAVSVFTDDRYRGYTLSDGRPVAIVDLYYDDPSGFYGTLSGKLVASEDEGVRPLGLILNAGYAKRLSSGITIDAGVTQSAYSVYSDRAAARSYSEAYVGVSARFLTARVYASPDYLKGGTIYGELNASAEIAPKLSLSGHAGLLLPLGRSEYGYSYRREFDWRIGIARQFGPVRLQVAWTGVRPGQNLYRCGYHSRQALVLGVTYAL
jgi:uncharacterized protein (TIGR02001 family)